MELNILAAKSPPLSAAAHVRPVPASARLLDGEARLQACARAQRVELSCYLRQSALDGYTWALDPAVNELHDRDTGNYIRVEPNEYAASMLRDGLQGHWGQANEFALWARLHRINVVLISSVETIDDSDATQEAHVFHEQRIYRVLRPDEPNRFELDSLVQILTSFLCCIHYIMLPELGQLD